MEQTKVSEMMLDIPKLIKELTLEEKAELCSGADLWSTKAVERLGIPNAVVCDGPHGLRKLVDGNNDLFSYDSVKDICFPSRSALASSFSRKLMKELGEHLGEEARSEGVHT